MQFDLLITNGLVVDGTGLPRRHADVAIRDGLVVGVGRFDAAGARRVIDASAAVPLALYFLGFGIALLLRPSIFFAGGLDELLDPPVVAQVDHLGAQRLK